MSFLSNTLKYFEESYIAYAERFVPYFVYSTTCHMFNLANQFREFYFIQGKLAQGRLHIYFVAPPGYTKTMMLRRFLSGDNSILGCTRKLGNTPFVGGAVGPIQCGFEGATTEAGFIGTFKGVQGGDPEPVYGSAHEYKYGVMGIDEFSALANMMKVEHSMNLDNAMLLALDSGWCIKRLGPGKIEYITQMTLQTGSQPSRFNLTSGLGRRLTFLYFIPTRAEQQKIKEYMRKGKNKRPDYTLLNYIRKDVERIQIDLMEVEYVKVDNSFYKLMDKLEIPHMEELLYERMAIGHRLASDNGCDKTLEVYVDKELDLNIKRIAKWRSEIKKGAETSQIWQVCSEMNGCSVSEVKQRLTDFGIEYTRSQHLLEVLVKQGRINIDYEKRSGGSGGRPAQVMTVNY